MNTAHQHPLLIGAGLVLAGCAWMGSFLIPPAKPVEPGPYTLWLAASLQAQAKRA